MKLKGIKRLSPEKRKQLVFVALITALILAGLGFGLIRSQFGVLAKLELKKKAATDRVVEMERIVQRSPITERELTVTSKQLEELEELMASGDIYSWAVTQLRDFKQKHKDVNIPQVGQPVISDLNMLPRFPYRQATIKVSGTAAYRDLGLFLADFENSFPHFRVLNLEVTPASTARQAGLLSFQFDLVTPIKPKQ